MTKRKGKVRDVRIYGDPALRKKAQRIERITDEILQLVEDLAETMLAKDGLGLAANQIGELKAMIALNPRGAKIKQPPIVILNPEIVETSGQVEDEEGCLSLPGITEVLTRSAQVRARGVSPTGTPIEVDAEGMLARAIQHEIDHLNGVLFVDHLPPTRRKLLASRLRELERRAR